MSDAHFKDEVNKYASFSTFEMRHAYDEKNTAEKSLIDGDVFYDKQTVMDENATLEKLLNISSTSTLKLPKLTQQKAREMLFSNKSYLLINENSKEDSLFMQDVKTSMRTLEKALYESFIGKNRVIDYNVAVKNLEKMDSLYETAINKCNDYLERGTGKRKVPFWPWHKKRYDAVDDMEKRLREERDAFKAKLEEAKSMKLFELTDKEADQEVKDKYFGVSGCMIRCPMDVLMIDRFNSDKITQEKEFLAENYESAVKVAKADVPAEFEKLDFAFGLYGGGDSVDTETFREKYGKHYFPELEGNEILIGKKLAEKNIDANTFRADMGKLADKIVNSDVAEILMVCQSMEKVGITEIPEIIQQLEAALKSADERSFLFMKKKPSLSISSDVKHMARDLINSLKILVNHPDAVLSRLDEKQLSLVFKTYPKTKDLDDDDDNDDISADYFGTEFEKQFALYYKEHERINFDGDDIGNTDQFQYSEVNKREFLKDIVKNPDTKIRLDYAIFPFIKDQRVHDTYVHCVRSQLYKKTTMLAGYKADSLNNMQQI